MFRIFFVSDIHGSDICFRKLLTLASERRPDLVIIGGDITGKHVVPIVSGTSNDYSVPTLGLEIGASELIAVQDRLRNKGLYPYICSECEYAKYSFDAKLSASIEANLQVQRLQEWLDLIPKKVDLKQTKFIINCGNDDPFYLDEILDGSPNVERPEARVIELANGLKLLSTGWTTPTPWPTPRQTTDDDLRSKIAQMVNQVADPHESIFNFHCPPKPSDLDRAPRLKNLRPVAGVSGDAVMDHVGSEAVFDAILKFKPVVGLHGHVHEGRGIQKIGTTTCVNPGTGYSSGLLQGAWITFEGKKLLGARLMREIEDTSATSEVKRVFIGLLEGIPAVGPAMARYFDTKKDNVPAIDARLQKIEESLAVLVKQTRNTGEEGK